MLFQSVVVYLLRIKLKYGLYKIGLILCNFIYQIHSLTARSVPRHFREGLKQNLPSPTDKNIKLPQPNVKTVPISDSHSYKKKFNVDSASSIDGSQEDSQNYRRMKVTTSAWGKKEETSPKTKNEEKLNIIYDSNETHPKTLGKSYLDGETPRTSSPEHLGIPAGPVRMPLQRKFSNQNNNINNDGTSTIGNDDAFNDQLQKRDRNLKKQGGNNSVLQESAFQDSKANAYTSDDSCVDSIPPSRVRHPPPNRRKITKSSANGNSSTHGDGTDTLSRQ